MKLYISFWMAMIIAMSTLVPCTASAHGNDDHEHSAPIATTAAVAPRATAQTDAFELVAVLQAKHLVIYLDRFDSNAAVVGATIEIEGQGKWKTIAKETEPGVYLADLPKGVMEGVGKYALTFSVQTEDNSDVLPASLDIAEEEDAHDHGSTGGAAWKWLVAIVGGLVLVAAMFVILRRRSSSTPSTGLSNLGGGAT